MELLISVVIPTHNRPQLLLEAIDSVVAQTYDRWEIIVVDDGSVPPVNARLLESKCPERVKIVRHDVAKKIAGAKNAGIDAAIGDVVVHLDDDDLFEKNALENINATYNKFPELDCLFIGVEAFGKKAAGTTANQIRALEKLLDKTEKRTESNVIIFESGLFEALLNAVPFVFQRPAARREAWQTAGKFREGSYFPEPEWAQIVSLNCRIGLIKTPLYMARMDGQNFITNSANKERHIEATIDMKNSIFSYVSSHSEIEQHKFALARKSLAQAYFDKAYYYYWQGSRLTAWKALFHAIKTLPHFKHVKFAFRIFLPRNKKE